MVKGSYGLGHRLIKGFLQKEVLKWFSMKYLCNIIFLSRWVQLVQNIHTTLIALLVPGSNKNNLVGGKVES